MKTELKKGDRVTLAETSRFFREDKSICGTVTQVLNGRYTNIACVLWDNGSFNTVEIYHLAAVSKTPERKVAQRQMTRITIGLILALFIALVAVMSSCSKDRGVQPNKMSEAAKKAFKDRLIMTRTDSLINE